MLEDNEISGLERLNRLHKEGALSDDEFTQQKARLLNGSQPPLPFYKRPGVVTALALLVLAAPVTWVVSGGDALPSLSQPSAQPSSASSAVVERFTGGQYISVTPGLSAEMRISQEGSAWTIDITGARTDGGPAPDCTVRAVGTKKGNQIVAALVPFETPDASMSADELGPEKRETTITINGNSLKVEGPYVGDLCGRENSLDGFYEPAPVKGQEAPQAPVTLAATPAPPTASAAIPSAPGQYTAFAAVYIASGEMFRAGVQKTLDSATECDSYLSELIAVQQRSSSSGVRVINNSVVTPRDNYSMYAWYACFPTVDRVEFKAAGYANGIRMNPARAEQMQRFPELPNSP